MSKKYKASFGVYLVDFNLDMLRKYQFYAVVGYKFRNAI